MSRIKSRGLRIEGLEQRNLMAGDVAVGVVNGDLIVTGDANDNWLAISQVGVGEYQIQGLNDGGGTTMINDAFSVVISGVTDDIRIELGTGNRNLLMMSNIDLNGTSHADLTINVDGSAENSADNNIIWLSNVDVRDDLRIYGSATRDQVFMNTVDVGDELDVVLGSGNDNLEMRNVFIQDTFDGNTGSGQDTIKMIDVDVNNDLLLDTGSSMDIVNMDRVDVRDLLWVRTGDHTDFVTVQNSEARRAHFWGDGGTDHLELSDNVFATYDDWSFEWVSEF